MFVAVPGCMFEFFLFLFDEKNYKAYNLVGGYIKKQYSNNDTVNKCDTLLSATVQARGIGRGETRSPQLDGLSQQ